MKILTRLMSSIVKDGELTLVYADGSRVVLGKPSEKLKPVTIRFLDDAAARAVVTDPALGAGEGYMNGRIVVDHGNSWDLLMMVMANSPLESGKLIGPPNEFGLIVERFKRWRDSYNKRAQAKANVAHHYDLSDELYDLFLDSDRQYSCAYFTDPETVGLEQAQRDKKAHIAAKLALRPGQKVLDIGCGWGGTALYLHRVADVDVLGITLSEGQLKVARQRAKDAGVADRVRFELLDYRDVQGKFDRIVSVGMFEHVGVPQYRTFFRSCHNLLARDGVMLLHTIGRLNGPSHTDSFTAKYIFPGGYCPALSEILEASQTSRLLPADIEVLRLHYFHTLRHWYDRAVAAKDQIVAMYDERFWRMWTYYLAASAAGFRHGSQTIYQLQFVRDRTALPITRDYMLAEEARYRAMG